MHTGVDRTPQIDNASIYFSVFRRLVKGDMGGKSLVSIASKTEPPLKILHTPFLTFENTGQLQNNTGRKAQ